MYTRTEEDSLESFWSLRFQTDKIFLHSRFRQLIANRIVAMRFVQRRILFRLGIRRYDEVTVQFDNELSYKIRDLRSSPGRGRPSLPISDETAHLCEPLLLQAVHTEAIIAFGPTFISPYS